MSIAKLFGFKGDNRKATILPTQVAELFGAKEGEAMEVEATEAGLTAIQTADKNLSNVALQVETLQNEISAKEATIKSLQTSAQENLDQIKALEESIETKDAKIAELEKAPATNHTKVIKSGDDLGVEDDNELRAEERKAQEMGDRIFQKRATTTKK